MERVDMKLRFRLFKRDKGNYFFEDAETGQQGSLRTRDKTEAQRLLNAKNEAQAQPGLVIQIARAYLAAADPRLAKRTWQYVAEELIKTKHGENARRWTVALKDPALKSILALELIQTRAEHFFTTLKAGTVSTNVFLRRLHNFALGVGWLLAPVLPPKQWPAVRHKAKRAVSREEHDKIIAREQNPERRAFYQLLWELGGAQGDVAKLCAEDVDWRTRTLSYFRAKTGRASRICFDEAVEEILRGRPSKGPLFPYLCTVRASDRATEFKQRCRGLGIEGVTLHSYRYSWAERAREAGYPERAAQEVLGHGSKAVHRAYARNANPDLVTIGAWKKRQPTDNVIDVEFNKEAGIPAAAHVKTNSSAS
jgi:integrase